MDFRLRDMVNWSNLLLDMVEHIIGRLDRIRIRKGATSREEKEIGGDVPPDMVDWSNLPPDIIEHIIGRLRCLDRIRMRAVCKAWSVSTLQIPTTTDNFSWAWSEFIRLGFDWLDPIRMRAVCKAWSVSNPLIPNIDKFPWVLSGDRLIYPPLHKQVYDLQEIQMIQYARALASSYGWVLFRVVRYEKLDFGNFSSYPPFTYQVIVNFFLYSQFTFEVIKFPECVFPGDSVVATFSLDATSPKCVIFGLCTKGNKICIYICSPGDIAWKTYEFKFDRPNSTPEHAAYASGIFYCVFSGGELGAFNLQLKKWTMLTLEGIPDFYFKYAKLIVFDGDLRLMGTEGKKGIDHVHVINFKNSKKLRLLKFDFSKKRWVKEISLNDRVLFIGGTCFSCVAVGETSQLANTVLSCPVGHPKIRRYGNNSDSRQYQNWAETASIGNVWIEFPSSAIWSANDLMTAP